MRVRHRFLDLARLRRSSCLILPRPLPILKPSGTERAWKMKTIRRTVPLLVVMLVVSIAAPAQSGLFGRPDQPRYGGTWESKTTGHHGRISARVKQEDCCTYRVTFCGTFAGIIPFRYSIPMNVIGQSADGTVCLHGQRRMPIFGDFTARACMNGCHFNAIYHSESDHGRFTMQRR